MLGLGTYTTRGGYIAHVTERGLRYWYGTIEGAGANGDPGAGVWMDDGRDYFGYDVFDILLPPPTSSSLGLRSANAGPLELDPPPTPVEERDRDGAL